MTVSLLADLLPHILVLLILIITIIHFRAVGPGRREDLVSSQPDIHIYFSLRYSKSVAQLSVLFTRRGSLTSDLSTSSSSSYRTQCQALSKERTWHLILYRVCALPAKAYASIPLASLNILQNIPYALDMLLIDRKVRKALYGDCSFLLFRTTWQDVGMILGDFSKIIELAVFWHGLAALCILQSFKWPYLDCEFVCIYIHINTYVHRYICAQTHTFPPP